MKKIIFALAFLLFLSGIAIAQTVTLGVQPTEVVLNFNAYSSRIVEFHFFNSHGDTDGIYTIKPDPCLNNIISNYLPEVSVPKGTTRTENPVKYNATFTADYTGDETCYLRISVKPATNQTVAVKPEIAVRIIISQPSSAPNTSTTTTIVPTTTTKTTTTTTDDDTTGATVFKVKNEATTIKPSQTTVPKTTTTTSNAKTTITQEEVNATVKTSVQSNPINLILIIGAFSGIGVFVFFFREHIIDFIDGLLFVFIVFSLFTPSVFAANVNIDVNVTVATTTTSTTTTTTIPTPSQQISPVMLSQAIVGTIIGAGTILFILRSFIFIEKPDAKTIAEIVIASTIVFALVAILFHLI